MPLYELVIEVVEVRGNCAAGYRPGDRIIVKGFYIDPELSTRICIHALISMSTILQLLSHGYSARELGIGYSDDEAYVQCPDPGRPYTSGGRVIFKLVREKL